MAEPGDDSTPDDAAAEAIDQERYLDPDGARDPDGDDPENWWERAYASDDAVPWDTGEPQPAVEALVDADAFADPVLDVGCGLGTHSRALANAGYDVTGVDVSRTAIADARAAAENDVDATFAVGDVLELGTPAGVVEADWAGSLLDVGVFHALGDRRREYADALARVLESGGRAFVLSFAPGAPEDWPPDRISRDNVLDAFDVGDPVDAEDADGDWQVVEFRDETFVSRGGEVPALLAVLEQNEDSSNTYAKSSPPLLQ